MAEIEDIEEIKRPENEEIKPKPKMTDLERLELAAKLDKDLDEFIAGLERKRYTDGWPEDRWQEEMDKHPFFMKKEPLPGEELHPLYEGIQQLKYDPAENTAEELALNYKEDGNWYMKHKKWRMAILGFTEGLKAKSVNDEVNSALYNNRSAAQFFLKNYRSSLEDAEKALRLKPDYAKPKFRAAQCNFYLNRFEECLEHVNDILEKDPENGPANELLVKCKSTKQEVQRNERRRAMEVKKKEKEFQRTVDELNRRAIKFLHLKPNREITSEVLKPGYLPLADHPVKADSNGVLHWPTAFLIPQFSISDFQQQLSEEVTMEDCLFSMFSEPTDYDPEHKYNPTNLNVYYENKKAGKVHKVDITKTIRNITQEQGFFIENGSLDFSILPKNSRYEEEFLSEARRPHVY